jgi:hypothetical protein
MEVAVVQVEVLTQVLMVVQVAVQLYLHKVEVLQLLDKETMVVLVAVAMVLVVVVLEQLGMLLQEVHHMVQTVEMDYKTILLKPLQMFITLVVVLVVEPVVQEVKVAVAMSLEVLAELVPMVLAAVVLVAMVLVIMVEMAEMVLLFFVCLLLIIQVVFQVMKHQP